MAMAICDLDEPHNTYTEILTIQYCPYTKTQGGCHVVLIDSELTDFAIREAVNLACVDLHPKELDCFEYTFHAIVDYE